MTENKLPKFSYSKLSTYLSCPMKFKLKYVDGNYDSSEAIHLDLGNIAHKVLEIKHRNIIDGLGNDYTYLKSVFNDGIAKPRSIWLRSEEETPTNSASSLIDIECSIRTDLIFSPSS